MEQGKNNAVMRRASEAIVKHDVNERVVIPVADIFETTDAFVLKLDMPGATKENIQLHIEPNQLSVEGAINRQENGNNTVLLAEIGRKKYFREFNIGSGVDHEKTSAQFEDGVLTITLPKVEEAKAREIQIH